jgi:hypothetical protein
MESKTIIFPFHVYCSYRLNPEIAFLTSYNSLLLFLQTRAHAKMQVHAHIWGTTYPSQEIRAYPKYLALKEDVSAKGVKKRT